MRHDRSAARVPPSRRVEHRARTPHGRLHGIWRLHLRNPVRPVSSATASNRALRRVPCPFGRGLRARSGLTSLARPRARRRSGLGPADASPSPCVRNGSPTRNEEAPRTAKPGDLAGSARRGAPVRDRARSPLCLSASLPCSLPRSPVPPRAGDIQDIRDRPAVRRARYAPFRARSLSHPQSPTPNPRSPPPLRPLVIPPRRPSPVIAS